MKPATPKPTRPRKPHVAIIGSGLAGLSAALWAAQTQARVTLLTKGIGGLLLSNGTIDILGFQTSPDGSETLAENPFDGLEQLPKTHPYRVIGTENLQRGNRLPAGPRTQPQRLLPQSRGQRASHLRSAPHRVGAERRDEAAGGRAGAVQGLPRAADCG